MQGIKGKLLYNKMKFWIGGEFWSEKFCFWLKNQTLCCQSIILVGLVMGDNSSLNILIKVRIFFYKILVGTPNKEFNCLLILVFQKVFSILEKFYWSIKINEVLKSGKIWKYFLPSKIFQSSLKRKNLDSNNIRK